MSKKITKEEALNYHKYPIPGKISVTPTKPFETQKDLSLAYTPGVAYPCLEIKEDETKAYEYTTKSNLVAVISNGTAVLGLGNIGALASKPVMEGKGILFKKFAGIDVFDIEIDETDIEKFCEIVKGISPTFGGINLEDIKAPECFEIERILKKELPIPVMHDDQHGTAVVSSAALINALYLVNKSIEDVKIVILGAGAAAIACGRLYKELGAKHIYMVDSKGVISTKRNDLNKYKQEFAVDTDDKTLEDAMKGADVFIGLSVPGQVTKEMVKSMSQNPIIFALSNPTPEIYPEEVYEARSDAIVATGRSDYPNQINNVLAFPFIFRGALDCQARDINYEMLKSAVYAIAKIAREETPEYLKEIYNEKLEFGKDYIIPKAFDIRLLTEVSSAILKTAIETGSARIKNIDIEEYKKELLSKLPSTSNI